MSNKMLISFSVDYTKSNQCWVSYQEINLTPNFPFSSEQLYSTCTSYVCPKWLLLWIDSKIHSGICRTWPPDNIAVSQVNAPWHNTWTLSLACGWRRQGFAPGARPARHLNFWTQGSHIDFPSGAWLCLFMPHPSLRTTCLTHTHLSVGCCSPWLGFCGQKSSHRHFEALQHIAQGWHWYQNLGNEAAENWYFVMVVSIFACPKLFRGLVFSIISILQLWGY